MHLYEIEISWISFIQLLLRATSCIITMKCHQLENCSEHAAVTVNLQPCAETHNPVIIFISCISCTLRLDRSTTTLIYSPAMRSRQCGSAPSSFHNSFSVVLPPLSKTTSPTFPFHCPIRGSSLYLTVRMGRRFTWDHLSKWSTPLQRQPLLRKQN